MFVTDGVRFRDGGVNPVFENQSRITRAPRMHFGRVGLVHNYSCFSASGSCCIFCVTMFRRRQMASEPREPKARFSHATVVADNKMLVWGGYSVEETSTVETFDVSSATWLEPRQLHGDTLPSGLYSMAFTADKKRAYVFGGYSYSTDQRYNKLFVIDLTSLECRELVPGSSSRPSARDDSDMVCYGRKLVIYGGYTGPGAISDELHIFDLDTGIL